MLTYQVQGSGVVTSMIIYKTTENSFSDDNDSANLFLFNVRTWRCRYNEGVVFIFLYERLKMSV